MVPSFFKAHSCLFLVFLLTLSSSCNKLCDSGYEGKRCDVPLRDKFIGVWSATDNPGNYTYLDTITEGSDILDLVISRNFLMDTFHRFIRATASERTITIAKQRPSPAKKLLVEGSGSINDAFNVISWNYNLIDTSQSPEIVTSFTGVWTKQ